MPRTTSQRSVRDRHIVVSANDALSEREIALSQRLRDVRARIAQACEAARRPVGDVTLIVVTKTYPASDVAALQQLGVRDVGENRDQEASAKRAEVEALRGVSACRWHLVGRLQSNKCRSVACWADAVHSLDRPRVIDALDAAVSAEERQLPVLVQVSLDGDPGRGGALAADVMALADQIAGSSALVLQGLMAVAPLDQAPSAAFERLSALSADLQRQHPGARWISAGMSQDVEAAVAAGATHVRIGSAVLGARPRLG